MMFLSQAKQAAGFQGIQSTVQQHWPPDETPVSCQGRPAFLLGPCSNDVTEWRLSSNQLLIRDYCLNPADREAEMFITNADSAPPARLASRDGQNWLGRYIRTFYQTSVNSLIHRNYGSAQDVVRAVRDISPEIRSGTTGTAQSSI